MPNRQIQIKITVSKEIHERLTAKATRQGLRVTQLLRHLLINEIRDEPDKAQKEFDDLLKDFNKH